MLLYHYIVMSTYEMNRYIDEDIYANKHEQNCLLYTGIKR